MPAASPDDVVKLLSLTSNVRATLSVSVFCNAGPIAVSVKSPDTASNVTLAADPYFRRKENYIAAGVVEAVLKQPDQAAAAIHVAFANHFPANDGPAAPRYRIQVAWLQKETILFKDEGPLPVGEVRNFHLLVTRQ